MKKQIFFPALALLVAANLFVFCAKEPVPASIEQFAQNTEEAGDRTPCLYKIYGNVRVCGTLTNNGTCTSCPPMPSTLTGVELVQTYWGSPLEVGPGVKLKICNPSGVQQSVTVVTNSGSQATFSLQPGQARNVRINVNCTISLGTYCSTACDQ